MFASLQVDRDRLQVLEPQILELRRSLEALETEQASVRERLDSYKYPVLTLPNEVASEIFVQFLPPYPLCPLTYGPLSPEHLLLICKKWTEIALSTPALWRAMDLQDGVQSGRLNTWLRRSGGCPLSFSIQMEHPSNEDTAALELLVPHRARWEYFELLRLPYTLFYGIPRHASAADRHTAEFPFPPALLPWAQLTSLNLIGSGPHECTPILLEVSNLVYCELTLRYADTLDLPRCNISLPHLESLVLVSSVYSWLPLPYLLCFVAPALRRLQLPEDGSREADRSDAIDVLNSFISMSGCKLEELRITGRCQTPSDMYIAAFPAIPKISFNPLLLGRDDGEMWERRASLADFQT
ncbi:hypothetical protein DFH06DRAFT_1327119 [Mycena polygramma]|nr:hypothetical protein DFH06DRAFT_1327119 [Mycena polygramma]